MRKYSIIVVTYNNANGLQRTLQSIRHQCYAQREVIVIDGGSKDESLKIIAENQDIITTSVSEKDNGIYNAMNKGIRLVTGDYVVFMNAGDFFPSTDTLEKIVHQCRLSEYPAAERPGVLYGNTNIVDGEGHFLHPRRLQPPVKLTWKSFRHGMLVCHQAFYARTDIAKNTQYDTRYRFSADVDWCIRIMRETERMGLTLCNTKMVVANYTEEGATTQNHSESLKERFHVMRRNYGLLTTLVMHAWFFIRAFLK